MTEPRDFATHLIDHLAREELTMKRCGHAAQAEGLRQAVVIAIKELREAEADVQGEPPEEVVRP